MIDTGLSTVEARIHNARLHAKAEVTGDTISFDELAVTSVCRRCFHTMHEPTVEKVLSLKLHWLLVSPSGCLHLQSPLGDADTSCGMPADRVDWWWPL